MLICQDMIGAQGGWRHGILFRFTSSSVSYELYVILMQDGLLRVLLDGGPSRLFVPSDVKYLEEDLEVLKVCLKKLCTMS